MVPCSSGVIRAYLSPAAAEDRPLRSSSDNSSFIFERPPVCPDKLRRGCIAGKSGIKAVKYIKPKDATLWPLSLYIYTRANSRFLQILPGRGIIFYSDCTPARANAFGPLSRAHKRHGYRALRAERPKGPMRVPPFTGGPGVIRRPRPKARQTRRL